MSSESAADHLRPVRLSAMATRPSEPEHLPCPRCDSINTKFCYYNNYNLSQPRHFCKSCRRYWTRGGTLRNVPVGGGSRKPAAAASNKRPRVDPTAAAVENEHNHHLPMSVPMATSAFAGCDVNLNEAVPEAPNFGSSFLNVNVNVNGGLLPYGNGFGLGLGSGLHGLGFGLGALDWAMDPISSHHEGGNNDVSHGGENGAGDVCGGDGTGSGSGGSPSHTWQMGSGVEGSLNDGDCFGWPDLAISMTGKGLK